MAIRIAGTDGTVTEASGAGRWSRVAPAVCVRKEEIPAVTAAGGRTVRVGAGVVLVAGVLVEITTPETLDIPADSSPLVCLSLVWGGKGVSRATVGLSAKPQLVRNPGVRYDVVLAMVGADESKVTGVSMCLPYTSGGMSLRHPSTSIQFVEAFDGADLIIENTGDKYRRVAGAWKLAEKGSSDWLTFNPTLSSDDGPVRLGDGGYSKGRYKLVGTRCLGEFEVRQGASNSDYGVGNLWITLPRVSSRYTTDQWFEGHVYTWREAPMDWIGQWGVRTGTARATLFAPTRSDDCRMVAARSADGSRRPGTGIPQLNNDFSDPGVVTGFFDYVIEEPKR